MPRRLALALIAGALAWMTFQGVRGLDRPGLHYDECSFLSPLLSARSSFVVSRLGAAGLPVMHLPHLGALKSWFYAPYVRHLQRERGTATAATSGPFLSPRAIRLPMAFVAAAAVALAAAAAWLLLGAGEAALAAWLLALDPAVLHFVREDLNASALTFLFRAAVLALLALHGRRREWGAVYLAAFVGGLGVWTNAGFALFLVVVLIAARVARPGGHTPAPRVVSRTAIAAAFVLGAAPAFVYWLTHFAETVAFARGGTLRLPLGPPWTHALTLMVDALRGLYPVYSYLGEENLAGKMSMAPIWFAAGAAFYLWRRLGARTDAASRNPALAFLLAALALHAGALVAWRSSHGADFFALSPVFHLALAGLAVFFLNEAFESPRARQLGAALLLAPLLITSLAASISAERTLDHHHGGRRMWSPRIVDLAAEIGAAPTTHFVFLDWGMADQVEVLLGGFDFEEIFWDYTDWTTPPAPNALDRWVRDPDVVFVCHAPRREVFIAVRRTLMQRVEELGLRFADRRIVEDTDGKPLYVLFRVDELGNEELWPQSFYEARQPS